MEDMALQVLFLLILSSVMGTVCVTVDDPCLGNPCFNNAACFSIKDLFLCLCLAGYTGIVCQFEINECFSIPCRNGGICADLVAGYDCHCLPGYTGLQCETEFELSTSFQTIGYDYPLSAPSPSVMTNDASYETTPVNLQIKASREADLNPKTTQVPDTLTPTLQTSQYIQEYTYRFTRIVDIGNTRRTESGLTVMNSALEASFYTTAYPSQSVLEMSCHFEGSSQVEYHCMCTGYERKIYVVTEETKESMREIIQKRLLVDTANLTKTTLKYKSVEDNRPSAMRIGAMAVVILVMAAAVIIVPDMLVLICTTMGKGTGMKSRFKL